MGIVLYCFHAVSLSRESLTTYLVYKHFDGLDPQQHRNLATLYAIKTAKTPGFADTVLVDQHAYIDLREFRRVGMDAKYISLANIEAVISKLPRGKNYVVVYGKGNYGECHEIKWAGGWTPELMRAYDVYQARLAQLHVLQHYEGPSQCLMALSPVQSNDDLTVGALSIP